jgi:hypothetical protein
MGVGWAALPQKTRQSRTWHPTAGDANVPGVRTTLRAAALLVAAVVVALWFFGGPNLGWTKDSVPHKERDPVTDIEVDVYEKRWVPGVDFLGVGLVAACVLAGASFLFRRKPSVVPTDPVSPPLAS